MSDDFIKEFDENNPGLFARVDIPIGTKLMKITQQVTGFENAKESDLFAQIEDDEKKEFVDLKNCEIRNITDSKRPSFADSGYKTYKNIHINLQVYRKSDSNTALVKLNDEIWLRTMQPIKANQELSLKFGDVYWLYQARKSENIMVRVVAQIYLDQTIASSNGISTWRTWTVPECGEYLAGLNIDQHDEVVKGLHVEGYNAKLILYRILQAVGYVQPPSGADYQKFPETLRTIAHQSRDLCFWPVQIGPSSEETEKMRQRMMDCIEYGPNASWIPFPKTKQLYLAAKNNNLDLAKEAGRDGNINAYGTCNHWTPLHVACYHGSLGVVNYLLNKGAVFNAKDTNGHLPVDLAEQQGHLDVAQSILATYTRHSLLVTTVQRLTPDVNGNKDEEELVKEKKLKGNEAFRSGNYKEAYRLYSQGLKSCQLNSSEKIILLSNRAQVLIQAKAYNFALRDSREVLLLDPTHEKTLLRMAHCYETIDATKTLEVLDLMMYCTVPDKLVHERRRYHFLKSILNVEVKTDRQEKPNVSNKEMSSSDARVSILGQEYTLKNIPMESLLELSLESLLELDAKVQQYENSR